LIDVSLLNLQISWAKALKELVLHVYLQIYVFVGNRSFMQWAYQLIELLVDEEVIQRIPEVQLFHFGVILEDEGLENSGVFRVHEFRRRENFDGGQRHVEVH